MNNGYAPVFGSVFRGTLCGKWPDLPVWLTLLPLMDSHGEIDMTHEAIAAITGWPLDLLRQAVASLEQPDPRSRSQDEEGRRLVRLDISRDWGWRVVNHALYRGLASGINQSRAQVADGRNAEKVRRYKERHRATPPDTIRTPEDTTRHQHSYSYSNTDSDKNPSREKTPSKGRACELPEGFALDEAMRDFALARFSDCDVARAFEQFKAHHMASGSKFKRWDMAWQKWVGNFAQYSYPKRSNGGWI